MAHAFGSSSMRLEVLTHENYDTWKIQVEALLIKNDAWDFVSGEKPKPAVTDDETNAAQITAWEAADRKAKADLILSINPSELKQIENCTTSREVWLKLETIYASKGPARKAALLRRLTRHTMQDGDDLREHISEFSDTVSKLKKMDISLPDELTSMLLIDSLPENFDNFRCAMESRDELPEFDLLKVKILEENNARLQKGNGSASSAMFVSSGKHSSNKSKDGADWKVNHESSDSAKKQSMNRSRCNFCNKRGHKESECRFKRKLGGQSANQVEEANCCFLTGKATIDPPSRDSRWCLDSGCTSHLCNNKNAFTRMVETQTSINLANNSAAQVKTKGDVKFATANNTVTLKNTLYLPELRTNLISVSKVVDNGREVTFQKDRAVIKDSRGNVEIVANRVGDLYYLHEVAQRAYTASETTDAVEAKAWHARLGHLNSRDMINMLRNQDVLGLTFGQPTNLDNCETCMAGKMSSTPFTTSETSSTQPLELVYSDVCGPMRVNSLGGARYFVTFIDDYSRWCYVYLMREKRDVVEKFVEFKNMAENQTGQKIKSIQSDNGREYCNDEMQRILKEAGIKHRLTVPHTPQQNGVAERKNRTLVEAARCMMIESGMAPSFWAEAILTANYVRNRCSTKALPSGTPYEKWTGSKPDVSHLRTFGSKVFILDKTPSKGKFEPRGIRGFFLGYPESSKAYRVWVPNDHKVHVSRDVKFLGEFGSESLYQDFSPEEGNSHQGTLSSGDDQPSQNVETPSDAVNQSTPQHNLPPRRGRGRPKIIRTGRRGRPRKSFNTTAGYQDGSSDDVETATREESPEPSASAQLTDPDNEDEDEDEGPGFVMNAVEIPVKHAMSGPNQNEWFDALYSEIRSLVANDTWEMVHKSAGMKVVDSRIVLRNKQNPDGTLFRRKARVVARGFSQRPGIDFTDTFAPVARIESLRLLLALAAKEGMQVSQLDVETAYLNGDMDTVLYMKPPDWLVESLQRMTAEPNKGLVARAERMLGDWNSGKKICKLRKALYGLKQAGRQWHSKLDATLKSIGLIPTHADPCMYFNRDKQCSTYVLVYVDDIVIVSKSPQRVAQIKGELSRKFVVKDLGEINYCLGIEIKRTENQISLCQSGYIQDVLRKFNMENCKPVTTPIAAGTKFNQEDISEDTSNLPFRELIGALMYLSTCTRPDITYAVNMLSQYNNCFGQTHWQAAKRILRYLKGTIDKKIIYSRDDRGIDGFADADWGSCIVDRRSYSGYAFILSGSAISWCSRKQRTVALSSTEAEYMCLTEAAKEAIFLSNFVRELGFTKLKEIVIYNDNLSAGKLAQNPVFHERSKHIDIRHHFIRQALQAHPLKLEYLRTEDMTADVLTKPLTKPKHESCVTKLGLC